MVKTLRWALVVALAAVAAPAFAGDDKPADDQDQSASSPADSGGDTEAADASHGEGDYGGVTPGKPHEQKPGKHARKARASRVPTVTWVGFQKLGSGSARVFVQLSMESQYEQHVAGDTLVVFLPGARVHLRNNTRFLDTSFFDTRVARVEAKAVGRAKGHKAGVELTIHFKKGGAGQADAKTEAGPNGTTFLFLDFTP